MRLFGKAKLFDSTKEPSGIHSYQSLEKTISCPHCGNNQFVQRRALLNTPGMTFFDLDWANKTATILVCSRCTHIHWFFDPPQIIA